jgi:hypothetical protein
LEHTGIAQDIVWDRGRMGGGGWGEEEREGRRERDSEREGGTVRRDGGRKCEREGVEGIEEGDKRESESSQ